jgi:transposase
VRQIRAPRGGWDEQTANQLACQAKNWLSDPGDPPYPSERSNQRDLIRVIRPIRVIRVYALRSFVARPRRSSRIILCFNVLSGIPR